MPEFILSSIIIQIISFLILLFFLNIIVYKPVRGILNKRKEEMDTSFRMTDEWKRKVEKYSEEMESNIDTTRKKGVKERTDLRNQGLSTEKELLHDAYSQVEASLASAKKEIKEKINNTRVSLQDEMESFSHELAEKILGRNLQ